MDWKLNDQCTGAAAGRAPVYVLPDWRPETNIDDLTDDGVTDVLHRVVPGVKGGLSAWAGERREALRKVAAALDDVCPDWTTRHPDALAYYPIMPPSLGGPMLGGPMKGCL